MIVGACKQAEDEPGVVVRLAETAGRRADGCLRLLGREVPFALEAWRIATYLVPDDPGRPVVETDLLERPI